MENLKNIRKQRHKTQAEVAEILNVTVSTYGNYELGQRSPTPETLIKLAEYFGVSVDYLLGRDSIITDEDRANGWVDTTKISIKPIEGKMLEVFREIGNRYGKETQEAAIAMLEKML